MFQFKNQPANLSFLHDKLFTLEWELPLFKWVLIYYVNGQKKVWYKKTERPYRFKRWFRRKPTDSFSNLANFKCPYITIYLFKHWISWPKKVVIPMKVNHLTIDDLPLQSDPLSISISPSNITIDKFRPPNQLPKGEILLAPPSINFNAPLVLSHATFDFPKCHWNVAEIHDKGLPIAENYTFEQIEIMSKN
jgi:hypothetical protein